MFSSQFRFPDLFMVVMVYPYYLHYDLPTGSALSLSWFGNKLSIRYIMNLSSANYPYIWGPQQGAYFFVYLCQIILIYSPYYSTHGLSHQNPVIAHKGLQGASIILQYPLHYKDNLTTICVFMLYRYCT